MAEARAEENGLALLKGLLQHYPRGGTVPGTFSLVI
jgi:hypothetical protein